MASDKIRHVSDIVDLCIKGLIALCVAGGGFLFKQTHDKIEKLEEKGERLVIVETWAHNFDERVNRMENKIDQILVIAKESR